MPSDGARSRSKKLINPGVSSGAVDQMNLRMAQGRARRWVDVMSSKVAAVLESLFNRQIGKILVTESDNLAFGHETCQLILASWGEAGKLDATNFGAGGWSQVRDLNSSG